MSEEAQAVETAADPATTVSAEPQVGQDVGAITSTPASALPEPQPHLLATLDQARALPELPASEPAASTSGLFIHFKNLEGRTMRIVAQAGKFFKQLV